MPVKAIQAGCIGRRDHLVVADRPAGLDHRGGARRRDLLQSVREGEEGVGGRRRPDGHRLRPARRLGCLARLLRRDARRIHSAHLAGADARGRQSLGIDDGVRLDVLADCESEQHVGDFRVAWPALGDDLQFGARDAAIVARLHQKTA